MSKNYSYLVEILINKMFELSGHQVTYQDVLGRKDDWYNQYTMTKEQQKDWIEFGIGVIRKEMKVPKYRAKKEMDMVFINWGLKCGE